MADVAVILGHTIQYCLKTGECGSSYIWNLIYSTCQYLWALVALSISTLQKSPPHIRNYKYLCKKNSLAIGSLPFVASNHMAIGWFSISKRIIPYNVSSGDWGALVSVLGSGYNCYVVWANRLIRIK